MRRKTYYGVTIGILMVETYFRRYEGDIGNAATPMTERMQRGVKQANGTMAVEPVMDVRHVANTIVTMANMPLDANIQFVTVMASKMPFIGRG